MPVPAMQSVFTIWPSTWEMVVKIVSTVLDILNERFHIMFFKSVQTFNGVSAEGCNVPICTISKDRLPTVLLP